MAPILGIYASSASPNIFATSYESIATVTVGAGGASSITFSSIPSTYTHLQIRGIARSARTESGSYIKIQFNSDTANNYANHGLFGGGASAGAYAVTTTDHAAEAYITAANDTASAFGASIWDVLDYTNTNKNKTVRALTGADVNGTNGQLRFASGVWLSTNAITSLSLTDGNGSTFVQYSSFALYGIKG
jgi:hypothetical protein